MDDFPSLGLAEPLLRALESEGYHTPTPVQLAAIPPLLQGRDVLGIAQTGTGKTAAFALPVLQAMSRTGQRSGGGWRPIRTLVLSPTRELAAQIDERFAAYRAHLDLRHKVIFGGVGQSPQVGALRKGVDILVATPGRLLDLENQGHVDLSKVEFFVLDEADRMLDMGFIHDVKRVLRLLPERRQNLLFSATIPQSITDLAGSFLHDAVRVEVTPEVVTVEKVTQQVMFVEKSNKRHLLAHLIEALDVWRGIVFTRTKHGADRLVKQLAQGDIEAVAIHGNKGQSARTRALDQFKRGAVPILVATDIASRGIDVDDVTHVFNFDLPAEPEVYVHRIGRTARAGKAGMAVAFCDDTEGPLLRQIEWLIGQVIPVDDDHRWHRAAAIPGPGKAAPHTGSRRSAQNARGPRGSTRGGRRSPQVGGGQRGGGGRGRAGASGGGQRQGGGGQRRAGGGGRRGGGGGQRGGQRRGGPFGGGQRSG